MIYSFLFLSFLAQQHVFSLLMKNPPNKCAKLTRQINPPKCLAMETCQIHPRVWPAKFTCQRSPLPRSRSPGRTWLANLPPPPQLRQRSRGEGGQEADLARLCILSRYFYFLMNDYIFLYNTTLIFYTERINKVYKYIAVGEVKVARRGWGAGLLPAPLKGVFCIIWILQEVSRHAILTRIGYEGIYNIPLYSNEYISA
jgi:hypothetical protein